MNDASIKVYFLVKIASSFYIKIDISFKKEKTIYNLSFIFFLAIFSSSAFSDVGNLPANTKTVVSIDSPYIPTGVDKHNYRYRAVFSQDVHNEVPGTLRVEKIQLPDAVGSPYKMVWSQIIDISKVKTIAEKIKSLPFESAIGCCDFIDIGWDSYRLKFNVVVADKKFNCTSADASKGAPLVECK